MLRGNPMWPPIVPVADMSFFKSGLSKVDKYNQFRSSALIYSAKYPPRRRTHCAERRERGIPTLKRAKFEKAPQNAAALREIAEWASRCCQICFDKTRICWKACGYLPTFHRISLTTLSTTLKMFKKKYSNSSKILKLYRRKFGNSRIFVLPHHDGLRIIPLNAINDSLRYCERKLSRNEMVNCSYAAFKSSKAFLFVSRLFRHKGAGRENIFHHCYYS